MNGHDLIIYAVYDNPKDYPGKIVVRRFAGVTPLSPACVCDTLEQARRPFQEAGLVGLMRMPGDNPVIVETWL